MNAHYRAILHAYTDWLGTLGFSASIVYNYPRYLHPFFQWLTAQKKIVSITRLTPQHLTDYLARLEYRPRRWRGGTIGLHYINQQAAALDKLLEFLHQQGMADAPAPTGYRLKTDPKERLKKITPLTQAEVKSLYQLIPHTFPNSPYSTREKRHYHLRLIFALHYACGLRRSEGCRLTLDEVDFDRRTVFVRQGKNYKDRIVPMSAGVYRDLQAYIYHYRHRHRPDHQRLALYSPGKLNDLLHDLQRTSPDQALKAKKLTLHTLRHSIATHLLQNGMPIENIARFLGHSSLEATQLYTHIEERMSDNSDK